MVGETETEHSNNFSYQKEMVSSENSKQDDTNLGDLGDSKKHKMESDKDVLKETEISRKGGSSNGSLEIQGVVLDSSNDCDCLDPRIDVDIAQLDISDEK